MVDLQYRLQTYKEYYAICNAAKEYFHKDIISKISEISDFLIFNPSNDYNLEVNLNLYENDEKDLKVISIIKDIIKKLYDLDQPTLASELNWSLEYYTIKEEE